LQLITVPRYHFLVNTMPNQMLALWSKFGLSVDLSRRTWRALRLVLFIVLIPIYGCDFQEDVGIGTALPEDSGSDGSGSDGGGSSRTDVPDDDDADGLSNDVEDLFGINTIKADTDHDGFDDGLEFVGALGDPLNGSRSPTSEDRDLLLLESEAIRNDPDRDQDGLGDTFEANNGLDPENPDTDGDGYQDGLELVANSNPFDSSDRPVRASPPASDGIDRGALIPPADMDGDGLAEEIEALNGTISTDRDTDGDGFSDGLEFLMGSDGTDVLNIPNFSVPDPPSDTDGES